MKWKSGEKLSAWLGLAVLAIAALGLRCVHLEDRPVHTDEAVHAVVLGEMLEGGTYRYDPHDSHGPALYYLGYPILRVMGVHDLDEMKAWQLRLISALIGAATVLLLALWAKDLGIGAVIVSGVLLALAAPFVYYQRDFIHEGLFVLLTLALLKCLWTWFANGSSIRLVAITGAVTALLFATKETAPLVLFAVGLAALGTWFTQENRPSISTVKAFPSYTTVLGFFLSFGAVFFLLYSSFGFNLHGLSDFIAAQFRFAHRAGGEGHEKPCWTYLAWLFLPNFYTTPWSGWIIAGLAVMGIVLRWRQPLVRLLLFFTLALAIFYSLIPYKTPWLELNLLAPATLLAGAGASSGWNVAGKFRPVLVLLAVFALAGLSRETELACFAHASDARNPLAYSPTVEDINQLVVRVGQLKAAYPDDPPNIIQVISTDYWPLPWYLRRLQPVGYYSDVPPAITGDILITSPDLLPTLQAKLGPGWKMEYFGLRPEVLAIVLYKPTSP